MFNHVKIGVSDFAASKALFIKALAPLGVKTAAEGEPRTASNCARRYQNSRGLRFQKRFGSLLLHLFNHQTHHRGQASTLSTQAGVDIGVTDRLELIHEVETA